MNPLPRPIWLIILAVMVVIFGLRSKADEPINVQSVEDRVEMTEVQFNGRRVLLQKYLGPPSSLGSGSRVRSASLRAELTNFDADPDPDGWSAALVLADASGQPVTRRASATFLLVPRVASLDGYGFVSAKAKPIRWARSLEFGEDGVARIRLPLKTRMTPALRWDGLKPSADGNRVGYQENERVPELFSGSKLPSRRGVTSGELFHSARAGIARPGFGQLTARVSVPGEGVFEAAAVVRLRPSVLVDTRWPYQ